MIDARSWGAPRWLPAVALLGAACAAQADPGNDPYAWLKRAAESARTTTYTGTFVHTNGDRTNTIRITHVSAGGDEHERIEPLDGPPQEIVRRNDEMFCYFPDAKTVRLDRRITARFFPSILRSPPESIAASYDVKLGNTERIVGHECRWIRMDPKDALRFAQRLCSEVSTGLVLRAKTFNEQQQVIEQYTFTDVKLGPQVAKAADVRSSFEARVKQWHTDKQPREEAKSVDTGWTITNPPAGFQKVTEIKRTMPGRAQPVSQIVLSDGVASLSVFVEANAPPRSAEASSEDGTTTFFVRPMGENLVTVLGEVPLATAQQVGRSVARRP
jgi:sigma-E factor negative regulatory protein RseB